MIGTKTKTKPELDEQQLEFMEETICQAMFENSALCFTYFRDEDFHLLIGKVHYVDTFRRELRIVDFHGEIVKVKLADLVDVKMN
ncbi:YolD-like family protein [Fictibacillus sp. S7]|uniref:YolD-like family protein n=1 Tax=Fictibacillus sp. S7 TaxID=2212476 RepID=UPI001F526E43|nr:YolD-like family protein [Fictibacillus sp. S7]